MDPICHRIEQLRKDNNLSQSELSDKIGISIATYTNLIRSCDFRISHLKKTGQALGVPLTYFFGDSKNEDLQTEEQKKEINRLRDEIDKLQQLTDLYSGLIDSTAESFRIIFMLSQFMGDLKIAESVLANNDNSIKFIGDFNEYVKNTSDKWVENINKSFGEAERIKEELSRMSKSQKFMLSFKRFFRLK